GGDRRVRALALPHPGPAHDPARDAGGQPAARADPAHPGLADRPGHRHLRHPVRAGRRAGRVRARVLHVRAARVHARAPVGGVRGRAARRVRTRPHVLQHRAAAVPPRARRAGRARDDLGLQRPHLGDDGAADRYEVPDHRGPAQPAGRLLQLVERDRGGLARRGGADGDRVLRVPAPLRLRAAGGDREVTEWELRTAGSSYAVRATQLGLELAHWGRPVRVVPPKGSFETPADIAPLEFAAAGTRHAQAAELLVAGGVALRLVLGSVEHTDHRLRALLRDDDAGLEVELVVQTSPDHEVVERWAVLRAERDLVLHRAFGAGWNVPVGPGARVGTLAGAWSRECTPAEVDLPAGQLSVGSRQGITSHTYAPVVVLRPRDGGDAYGIALAWSGSWRLGVDAVPFREVVRVSGGIADEGPIELAAGEELETPHLLGVHSPDGPAGVARAWHAYQRRLARGPEHRPIVYNSWYATTFDVRVEHQLALADAAAEVGVEVFVVDDGWFRGRTSDRAGLGDWFGDEHKVPDGLAPVGDGGGRRGMRFGLRVEREAVSPDSELYRAPREWVHRPVITRRNQYVLDLGNPEVEAWVAAMLHRLLTEHPVSYLKWDMNRAIPLGGSVAHTRAYHRLMRMLREEFPHVTVEACAGGGGRVDNAVLAVS